MCALLAGGDVALSVVLTTSTTLLGVVATPALASALLAGADVQINGLGVLRSTARLVLAPLLGGLAFAQVWPKAAARLGPVCPTLGILSTLLLVVGGAANAAHLLAGVGSWKAHAAAILLPLGAAVAAYCLARVAKLDARSSKTVCIESLVKSPTIAFVLASKHLGAGAAGVPAAAMIWLAALGAAVAVGWASFDKRRETRASSSSDWTI